MRTSGTPEGTARRRPLLPQRFYEENAATVAKALLGQYLCLDAVVLRVTETEAYLGREDSAAHARFGVTTRTAPLFGPPGHAYVYLCYGLHWMLNVVTGPRESGAAVLIRACEPVEGERRIRRRRGGRSGPMLLAGPGKIGAALAVDRSFNDHPFFTPGGLELRSGAPPTTILVGARVGIDFATPLDRGAPLRFAAGDTAWVTMRRSLRPLL